MKFRFCVPGRNHAAFTEQCLRSILTQEGKHDFVIDWVDDASDKPEAFQTARKMFGMHPSRHQEEMPYLSECVWKNKSERDAHAFRLERRSHRVGGMKNLYDMGHRADDDEILVIIGGDDHVEPFALSRIAEEYKDPQCWLTYGTYENSDGFPKVAERWHGADPRASKFVWAPLTVKAWLWKKMFPEDLQIGSGLWMPSSADVAFTLPLVEMAGVPRCRYVEDVWYRRRVHPGNDHNTDSRLQTFCGWMACAKDRYSRLAGPNDTPKRTPHKLSWSILFSPRVQFGAPCDIE